jgi:glutathione synthase/RimK-type ligase-like ATP-grasp enzyme
VCKPLFGSQGKGVIRIAGPEDLPEATAVNGVWYLQRFVASAMTGAVDWRLFVIGGRVAAAMRRSTPGWLTNVAQGGLCQAALPDQEVRVMAERAVEVLDMAYAGVDLMQDGDGRWWILEVNSIPAWRGLQSVVSADIAGLLVDDLLRGCGGGSSREAV